MRNFYFFVSVSNLYIADFIFIMSNDNNRGGNNGIDDMIMRDVIFTLKAMQQQFEGFGREMMNMRGDLEEVKQSQYTDRKSVV